MAEGEVPSDIVDRVMDKIERFYFGDGDTDETNGEQLFYTFAQSKHEVFEADCDAELTENKVQ